MKRGGLEILIILTLVVISATFIEGSVSCAESNALGNYYRSGMITGDSSTVNALCNSSNNYCDEHFTSDPYGYWIAYDYCDNGNYLFKSWCMSNGIYTIQGGLPVYERHLCEYGCQNDTNGNGHCLSTPMACIENWVCTDWNNCVNNNQTRTCTDTNSCGTNISRPALSQICGCIEDWNCWSWSSCASNNIKTRICGDANDCGTTANKPNTTQSCTYNNNTNCIENWACTNWSLCRFDGDTEVRTCTDLNNCGTVSSKPIIFKNCISNEPKEGLPGIFINNTEVIFKNNPNGTNSIETNKTLVKSSLNITEESGKLYATTSSGNKEIKILPEDAISISKEISNVDNITLNEYNGEIVYTLSGTKETRLLFIIPVVEKIETKINAGNGDIMSITKPWWHFLTF